MKIIKLLIFLLVIINIISKHHKASIKNLKNHKNQKDEETNRRLKLFTNELRLKAKNNCKSRCNQFLRKSKCSVVINLANPNPNSDYFECGCLHLHNNNVKYEYTNPKIQFLSGYNGFNGVFEIPMSKNAKVFLHVESCLPTRL